MRFVISDKGVGFDKDLEESDRIITDLNLSRLLL